MRILDAHFHCHQLHLLWNLEATVNDLLYPGSRHPFVLSQALTLVSIRLQKMQLVIDSELSTYSGNTLHLGLLAVRIPGRVPDLEMLMGLEDQNRFGFSGAFLKNLPHRTCVSA